jgi:hypothetical protein
MEEAMKLTCYAVVIVVLGFGSLQMARAHLKTSQPVFCPDYVGCIPVPDVQWKTADMSGAIPGL